MYYLQTRYYDPEIGQFISPDSPKYLDPESIAGFNLYAYCGYNPVMNVDPTGTLFWSILISSIVIGAIVGGISGGISAKQDGKSFWSGALVGALTGAVTGAAFGFGGALGMSAFAAGTTISATTALLALGSVTAGSFAAGIGINYLETKLDGTEFSWSKALKFGGALAIKGAAYFGMGLLLGSKGYWPIDNQKYVGMGNKIIGAINFTLANSNLLLARLYLKKCFPISI